MLINYSVSSENLNACLIPVKDITNTLLYVTLLENKININPDNDKHYASEYTSGNIICETDKCLEDYRNYFNTSKSVRYEFFTLENIYIDMCRYVRDVVMVSICAKFIETHNSVFANCPTEFTSLPIDIPRSM